MLDEHAEHQLNHATVKGLVDERQADIEIDDAILAKVILENLILLLLSFIPVYIESSSILNPAIEPPPLAIK